jgi:hypothetical protein
MLNICYSSTILHKISPLTRSDLSAVLNQFVIISHLLIVMLGKWLIKSTPLQKND